MVIVSEAISFNPVPSKNPANEPIPAVMACPAPLPFISSPIIAPASGPRIRPAGGKKKIPANIPIPAPHIP